MNWIYILVLCLAIYYIAARYLEKHIDNFDPSLVPVSSIVTLAKVAQKLVDGNGTLTNPGNLTLGTAAAPGNLVVTGISNLVGDTKVDGSLTVNGNKGIVINGTDGGTTKTPFKIFNNNNTWLSVTQDSNEYLLFRDTKVAEIDCDTTVKRGLTVTNNLTVNGTSNLKGNTTIDGNSVINGSVTIGPKTNPGYIFDGNSKTRFSWMPNGSTIVNALPGNSVEFNDSNGIVSGVNINMNGTVTAPILSTPTATITTATITTATITGNLLMKSAAFRVKFHHGDNIRYLSQSSGAPVVNKTKNTTDNSDYWIECGARLLNIQTNSFLTTDSSTFTLEGINASKRQMVKLTSSGMDAGGTYFFTPPLRYIFMQLDSNTSAPYSIENNSYLAYKLDNTPEALTLHTYGSGQSYFIKVA